MKISNLIKNLEELKKEHGDLECFTAIDDEGNGYNRVYFKPSIKYTLNDIGESYTELIDKDEAWEEFEYELESGEYKLKKVCVIN